MKKFILLSVLLFNLPIATWAAGGGTSDSAGFPIKEGAKYRTAVIGCGHLKSTGDSHPRPESVENALRSGVKPGTHDHPGAVTMNTDPDYNPDIVGDILNPEDVKKMGIGTYDAVFLELGGAGLAQTPKAHINGFSLVKPGGVYFFDGIRLYGMGMPLRNSIGNIEEQDGNYVYTGSIPFPGLKPPKMYYDGNRIFGISSSRPFTVFLFESYTPETLKTTIDFYEGLDDGSADMKRMTEVARYLKSLGDSPKSVKAAKAEAVSEWIAGVLGVSAEHVSLEPPAGLLPMLKPDEMGVDTDRGTTAVYVTKPESEEGATA